ncbi:ParB/RepB/Spo0J family plasmid partition protein [Yokenella regensburgei]|uniref:ParB/RepB/Spo0J family plasmid partition protein n=1 Tax=Yokenella regensburgei TaxID=158877 RepID=UPI003ED98192
MKRAPVIPKTNPSTIPVEENSAPAAPMVDSLIARVGAMAKGNVISLPICGKEVKFTLETIPGKSVAETTKVWAGNERDQELLTEDALDDLIPSFLLTGQQNPAFGRKVDDFIEVADGSRRRMTAILTSSEYRILVGDLDNQQMDALCKIGNDYRPTSAYERGKRYTYRLSTEFNGNISALADAENISRKIINRCISTAKLPKEVIALFSHPGELSARAGELLQRNFTDKESLLLSTASELAQRKNEGVLYEPDEILQLLNGALKETSAGTKPTVIRRQFVPGATVQYKGNKVIFNLDRTKLPEDCIDKIEGILNMLNAG